MTSSPKNMAQWVFYLDPVGTDGSIPLRVFRFFFFIFLVCTRRSWPSSQLRMIESDNKAERRRPEISRKFPKKSWFSKNENQAQVLARNWCLNWIVIFFPRLFLKKMISKVHMLWISKNCFGFKRFFRFKRFLQFASLILEEYKQIFGGWKGLEPSMKNWFWERNSVTEWMMA